MNRQYRITRVLYLAAVGVVSLTISASAFAADSATRTTGAGGFWLMALLVYLTRKRPMGGWLALYFWQAIGGALLTCLITAATIGNLAPSRWDNKAEYLLALISDLPPVVCLIWLAVVSIRAFSKPTPQTRRHVLMALGAVVTANAVGFGIDYFVFPDAIVLSALQLASAVIWLLYWLGSERVALVFSGVAWNYEAFRQADKQNRFHLFKPRAASAASTIVDNPSSPRSSLFSSMPNRIGLGIVVIASLAVGFFLWTQPRDFDDCILANMHGATSDLVTAMIRQSCREKFPERKTDQPKSRALNLAEISKVTGRAGLAYGSRYSGTLYNGNDRLTLTQVEILITTQSPASAGYGKYGDFIPDPVSRTYAADVTIPTKTTGPFGFDIIVGDAGAKYTWSVVSAKGFEQ